MLLLLMLLTSVLLLVVTVRSHRNCPVTHRPQPCQAAVLVAWSAAVAAAGQQVVGACLSGLHHAWLLEVMVAWVLVLGMMPGRLKPAASAVARPAHAALLLPVAVAAAAPVGDTWQRVHRAWQQLLLQVACMLMVPVP